MSEPPKTPPELDAIARVVLAYKPKDKKVKLAKKRKKVAKMKNKTS